MINGWLNGWLIEGSGPYWPGILWIGSSLVLLRDQVPRPQSSKMTSLRVSTPWHSQGRKWSMTLSSENAQNQGPEKGPKAPSADLLHGQEAVTFCCCSIKFAWTVSQLPFSSYVPPCIETLPLLLFEANYVAKGILQINVLKS